MSSSSAARASASARFMPSTVIGASMQFAIAVMCGKRLKDWNTMPILARMLADMGKVGRHQLAVPAPYA